MRVMKYIVLCAAVAMCCAADEEKAKKPTVMELMRPANQLIAEAQDLYVDGEPKEAVELYRKAHEKLLEIEVAHLAEASTPEFAPVRFRKALCEREINRILLEGAQTGSRTMTVTNTQELEKKREARMKAAETDPAEVTPVKLGSKKGNDAAAADAAADVADGPVGDEMEWAKDMIQFERFDEAEQSLLKVLRATPENREARFLMALSRVRQGRNADALVVLDGLLDDDPSDEAALLLAAGAYMAAGAYSKAIDVLDKAMKVNPKRPDALVNMAWLLLEMRPNDTSEAEQYYRLAVKMGAARVRDLERRLGIKPE